MLKKCYSQILKNIGIYMKKYKVVCAIIVNHKDEILLTQRAREPFKGKWALPSGIGESMKGIPPEIGVIEEVRCDLGTSSFRGKFWGNFSNELVVFVGTIDEAEIKVDPRFSLGYKWVAKEQKNEFEDLAFEHSEIVKRFSNS